MLLIDDVPSKFYDEQSVVVELAARLRVLASFAVVEEEDNHLLDLTMMLKMETAKLKPKKNNENLIIHRNHLPGYCQQGRRG